MRHSIGIVALLLLCAPFVQSCGGPDNTPPPGTTPIRELISQNRSPVEIVSFRPDGNLVVRRFKLVLKNVSDKPVKMVQWTQLLFTADGALIGSGKREGGFAELGGIAPGETYEGVTIVEESAAKGSIVVKSVTYESVPPGAENNPSMQMYKINYQWKNPDHDATVRALTSDVPPAGAGTRI